MAARACEPGGDGIPSQTMRRLSWLPLFLAGCGNVTSTDPDASIDARAIDAAVDAAPDAPPVAQCGDGRRDPGEVCFGTAVSLVGTDVVYDARLGDIDSDNDRDVVYLIGDQFVAHVNANGTFSPTGLPGATAFATFLMARDLNGDGRVELIDQNDSSIELWRTNAGSFGQTRTGVVNLQARATPGGMVFAELDGAAPAEIVGVYSNLLAVAKLGANLGLSMGASASLNPGARSLDVGRLDGDMLDDIVVGSAGGITVHRGMAGGFAPTLTTPVATAVLGVAVGDFDRDGTGDIAFSEAGAVGVMRGAGAGAFLAPSRRPVAGATRAVDRADVDGDGRADLAVGVSGSSRSIAVLRGQADGTLALPVLVPIAVTPDYVHFDGDINGDGAPDLLVTDINTQTVLVIPSNP